MKGPRESPVTGFLGPRGTFTEGAARAYAAAPRLFSGADVERILQPFDDIPSLLRAAARGDVDDAVVPVENSIEGTVNVTLDTLVHEVDLHVVADIVLPIRHHLLVPRGADWRRIVAVVSHPQALAQCRLWLDKHLPGVRLEAALSTAAAAARIGNGGGQKGAEYSNNNVVAAIGNFFSAELYGLDVAVQDIQGASINETRFFVVRPAPDDVEASAGGGPGGPSPEGPWLTSVAFAFAADGPGNLYVALGEFARRGVNLTKLESRPARQALGEYIFFVDFEGHKEDGPVADALHALGRACTFVKVLGSYRRVQPEMEQKAPSAAEA